MSTSRALCLALLVSCAPQACAPQRPEDPTEDRSAQLVDPNGNNNGTFSPFCKTITVSGRVDYNDQRKYGRFPIHHREDGSTGTQYRITSDTHEEFDHAPNYLGLLDATVELYEVDRSGANNYCSAQAFVARVIADAEGRYTWTGQVCDPCGNDDSIEGASGLSIAAKVLLQYCPLDHERCFFVEKPSGWLNDTPRFEDHGNGASTYFRWATLATPTQPQVVRGSSITLPTTHYEAVANDKTDLDAQAAMVFASIVDVTRKVHVGSDIPFKFDEFGDVKVLFPMNFRESGAGHSHESGRVCLPAWGRVNDEKDTIKLTTEDLPHPNKWPDNPCPLHEYGHIVMYRALHGHGKWVDYSLDWNNDGKNDGHESDPLEYTAAATKEPWANFIAYATLSDVTGPESPGAPVPLDGARARDLSGETMDVLGCGVDPEWDDEVDGAEAACAPPLACPEGKKAPHAIARSLCDWLDERNDGASTMWSQTSESFSSPLKAIYTALEDSWLVVPQSVRDDYERSSSSNKVRRGIHGCDIAQAYVNAHPSDRSGLDEVFKHNGIDCELR